MDREDKEHPAYESLPYLHGKIKKESYEFIKYICTDTVKLLGKEWVSNLKTNSKLWRRQGKLLDTLGLGVNKCVIGIGSGASFNKNKDVLKEILNKDGVNDWPDRNFITIAANHQFKPLLEMGIIPDFVLLCDASDVVYDQLVRDIPDKAKGVQLICGLHASPKVLNGWVKQGRSLLFYMTPMLELQEAFRKHIRRDPIKHQIEFGGNVLNGAFMTAIARFKSNIFFCVGNDLSFEIKDTIEEQRNGYYADHDYSTNQKVTGTGRDEAATEKKWAGISISKRKVWMPGESKKGLGRYNIDLNIVGTSHTLWVYKTWLETTILGQTQNKTSFHYFNCTEGGILGVLAKEDSDEALKDPTNWFLLDEVSKNKFTGAAMYHTAMLDDAAEVFLREREAFLCQNRGAIPTDAHYAGVLEGLGRTTIAELANRR